ncbi:MAG: DUF2062 domain-containing protein [Micavibrio sp.]|nr:DUF2062 domain-containing protein [Micavibrio sp.]
MGWVRAARYTKMRIVRLSDSSQHIALGLSIGTAISFTPLVGTHFIQAGFLAWLTRANFISALIGTFAGNPWTFPFMWWASVSLGTAIFHMVGMPVEAAMPEEVNFAIVLDIIKNEPFRIFGPWFVGGYLLGLISIPFTYVPYYSMVSGAKIARKKARERKIHKFAREVTGQKK